VNRRNLALLVIHEGAPGHHLQIRIAPRSSWGVPAFGEGWASYAEELLASEMNDETNARYSESLAEMNLYRAVSVFVSNGVHSKGWTVDMATDVLREYLGSSEEDLRTRVETIVALPGLQFRYAVGKRAFSDLREEAESSLGPRFDLRAFHHIVLEDGSVTLDMLREKVDSWIADQVTDERGLESAFR
jgi:uncharacterized protein (DUF885 family)